MAGFTKKDLCMTMQKDEFLRKYTYKLHIYDVCIARCTSVTWSLASPAEPAAVPAAQIDKHQ